MIPLAASLAAGTSRVTMARYRPRRKTTIRFQDLSSRLAGTQQIRRQLRTCRCWGIEAWLILIRVMTLVRGWANRIRNYRRVGFPTFIQINDLIKMVWIRAQLRHNRTITTPNKTIWRIDGHQVTIYRIRECSRIERVTAVSVSLLVAWMVKRTHHGAPAPEVQCETFT